MPVSILFEKRLYELEFREADWEELLALSFEPFEFAAYSALSRAQWLALGEMALGKAQRIDEGAYDMGDGYDDAMPAWADHLRSIASVIFNFFQPGDGQL